MEMDRTTLVNLLDVQLKTETSESRDTSVKVGVDRKLAKLFGAKLFLSYDWNVFSKPTYSLEEIKRVLNNLGIKVPAQDLIKENLRVNRDWDDYYSFDKIVDPKGIESYRLSYSRETRPQGYSDWK